MKAFIVQDDYGDSGAVIRFSQHSVVARRQGAIELSCDFSMVTCRRYPAFDQYADRGVPDEVLVAHGWWFECFQCGQKIEAEPADENGDDIVLTPIYAPNRVWCSQSCKDRHCANKRAERRRAENAATAALIRWPGIRIAHIHGYGTPGRVHFWFPGGEGQGDWEMGETTLHVERRDLEAWERFADQFRPELLRNSARPV